MQRRKLYAILTLNILLALLLAVPGALEAADARPQPAEHPFRQDMQEFIWADYGVSLTIPADWSSLGASQDYDLALVSPAAMQSGAGAFIIFEVFPSLGGDSPQAALQPIADDTGSAIQEFGSGGYGVTVMNEQAGIEQNLVLYPYNAQGAALLVQTSGSGEDNGLLMDILASLMIDPPQLDYAAADAAFQASLEAEGVLVYGDPGSPVKMREYFSYTCGHCANYTLPLENLIALDVETGRAWFELAPLASDEKSTLATHATYCAAAQGKGYSVYKALFNDYLQNGYENAYTEDAVQGVISRDEFGLDVDAMNTCIEDQTYADEIASVRTTFTDFGLTGTPTVVMAAQGDDLAPIMFPDGQVWSGTIPLNALREITDTIIESDVSAQEAANTFFGG